METIPLSLATVVINALGVSGLIFIIWHFDNKRDQRKDALRRQEIKEREKEIAEREGALTKVLAQYKDDVSEIKRLYENNVHLVEEAQASNLRLEKLYGETLSVISLNTQAQTGLVKTIENNRFCPLMREKGMKL
ncbi:hypothetical protein DSCO28_50550 [Desulfosarcina ovata subsp. sediminis]|uniref:Uncharacterized protein n=1 Tax=Desulfosarcina ovata subsp. sediminis TaxID=885957 RepID=A0A5K7ZW61_9BACT|nr:hypothetical protein [Desulfosarcina ovata]BBO80183.1 hypothetical protein DSCO28_07490 [Desulfosarcina ovata subsp. sediminis]BBO84489.1 hypothetical protein DSCO28_50550 [Desulfosarcina ovata subsp. sediminis]